MAVPSKGEDLVQNEKGLQDIPCTQTLTVPSINVIVRQEKSEGPSEEELVTLRRIGSKINAAVWLVALFSGAERFAFYALQAPLRN